jgi:hypothetical protein
MLHNNNWVGLSKLIAKPYNEKSLAVGETDKPNNDVCSSNAGHKVSKAGPQKNQGSGFFFG